MLSALDSACVCFKVSVSAVFCFDILQGGSVAEWLACWTQAQKGPGSNSSRNAVVGSLFTPIVPLFTKQWNW